MPRPQSINQIHLHDALPNFRSLGVILRTFLSVNGIVLLLSLLHATTLQDFLQQLMLSATLVQPILLSSLLLLYLLNSQLARLQYQHGIFIVTLIVILITLSIVQLGNDLYLPIESNAFSIWRYILISAAASIILLQYFRWRFLMLSPAIFEARFQALQARIRPHFLFNCINSVISIVRNNPKRAESALEDMSDLFRTAMEYGNELVPLNHEIQLSRQYLSLEQLRLGNRLTTSWHIDDLPDDALVPPLILQPLLENSVYHGIEPLPDGGIIDIRLAKSDNEIHFDIYNPRLELETHRVGNKLALANIRERLALLFDIEAHYTVEIGNDFYHVHIVMPYVGKSQA
jgi:two-component system, LytTR family, sensor histidine kinase AlgZ